MKTFKTNGEKKWTAPFPVTSSIELLRIVQHRCATLEKQVHSRDLREVLAALLVVGIFAPLWPVYRSSRVAMLGVTLIVLGAALIVYVLLAARSAAPLSLQTSVLEFSRNRLVWIDRQIHMLRTVIWWYVTPICAGVLLLTWGVTKGDGAVFGVQAVATLCVGAVIVYLNHWTVRNNLRPIRDDLIRLIESLEPGAANDPTN